MSFETFSVFYYDYHSTTYYLVPTDEWDLEAKPLIPIHHATLPGDVFFPQLTSLPFFHQFFPRFGKVLCHSPQRIGDFHLMDRVLECGQFCLEIRLINYCRLYLQVHTIAEPFNGRRNTC
jgi:hypothetical protein